MFVCQDIFKITFNCWEALQLNHVMELTRARKASFVEMEFYRFPRFPRLLPF